MPRCHLTNVVWGEAYCRLFLDHVLPNHLAPGNIPAISRRCDCHYYVYTTKEDKARMEPDAQVERVRRWMPLTFVALDRTAAELKSHEVGQKYSNYARYLRQAVMDALAADAAILNLCPDVLMSDGTFVRAEALWAQGVRLICLPSVRVTRDPFLKDYAASCPPEPDGLRPCRPADLIPVAMRNLHPLSRTLIWTTVPFNDTWPSNIYWLLPDHRGLIARVFHAHAFLIDPLDKKYLPQSTLDDDYIQRACPDSRHVHFVQDSDEMLSFEMSPPEQLAGQAEKGLPANPAAVAAWAARHCTSRHLEIFDHPMLIHAGPPQPSDAAVHADSRRVARQIQGRGLVASATRTFRQTLNKLFSKHP
jgi:hypothetical protein